MSKTDDINTNLFVEYAQKDIDIWKKLLGCKLKSTTLGEGIIINISHNFQLGSGVYLSIEFLCKNIWLFDVAEFTKGSLYDLEVPEDLLVEMNRRISDENKSSLDEEAKKEIDELYDEYEKDNNQEGLIELSHKIADLINRGLYVKEEMSTLNKCKKIVGVYLTNKDVDDSLEWISQIDESKVYVKNIKNILREIKALNKGIMVEDIKDAFLLRRLGKLHKELESPEKAFNLYEKSLEIEPDNRYALNGIGGVCNMAGWPDKALKYYSKCLDIERNSVSYTGLGATYRDLERHDEALSCYLKALELNIKDTYANNGIGAVYFDLGYYDEGEKHFSAAGKNDGYMLGLAEGYISKGMTENAIRCLELILQKAPKNREARYLYEKYKDDYKQLEIYKQ